MPFKIDTIETDNLRVNGTQITENGGSPYKVYTALLTQSGGDDEQTISGGPVTQGVTYWVIDNDTPGSNWDFSNVGGPTYPFSGYFVATNSEIPISYFGSMVRYNTGAPVVTVLENTIGNIWFEYLNVGEYSINSDELFTLNKTTQFINSSLGLDEGILTISNGGNTNSLIYLSSTDNIPERINGFFSHTPIEIRVYN
jgi:hypothetical protein